VLVTGASRGLGEEVAVALGRRGAKLVLVARGESELFRVHSRIVAEGGTALAVPADVADKEAAHRIAALASAAFTAGGARGGVDVLIHNAGTLGPTSLELLLDTDCEDLEHALAVNVVGPFRITKTVLGHMTLARRGLVVAVSSDAAVNAYPTWGTYGASKAALEHTMRTFAAESEGTGVRFLVADPGEMDTRMHADALPDADRGSLTPPRLAAERLVRAMEAAQTGAEIYSRVELASFK
jgi:NAD(P)-dependent dehydrogenase (short-subunit alcohol dehydrogenase family)